MGDQPKKSLGIDDLGDVNLSGLGNNEILKYNTATQKWENTSPAYGCIYLDDGSVVQVTNAISGTYDIITGFTDNPGDGFNSGNSNIVIEAVANNKITIPANNAGQYQLAWSASFSGTANTTYTLGVFVNGVRCKQATTRVKLPSTDLDTTGSATCIANIGAGASDIDLRVTANGASKNFTPAFLSLAVLRVAF